MNLKIVCNQIGKMLILIGLSMLLPQAVAIADADSANHVFLVGMLITTLTGILIYLLSRGDGAMHIKEGFVLVSAGWVIVSIFGTIPMYLSGYYPTILDAFFETLSGFTATGITVVDDIESLPRSILLWRSLTQWLGGMGIVVLFVALLSSLGTGGMQLFKAEITGPVKEKIRPRISDSAKSLWYIYMILTILNIAVLYFVGMDLFDAINHGMTTISTGGYSTKNSNYGYYDAPMLQWATVVFMFIAGFSFATVYRSISKKSFKVIVNNSEVRMYALMIVVFTSFLCLDLVLKESLPFLDAVRIALFNVTALITTTGFIIHDYELWSSFAQTLLLFLMFSGACAGSTSGGIKIMRLLILLKQTKNEFLRILHPRLVTSLKINEVPIPTRTISNVSIFVFLYISIIFASTIYATWFGLPFMEAFTTSLTCMGNGGPSFGVYGPTESFSALPAALKIHNCFLMLIGRLEIYTLFVAFVPMNLKRVN